MHPQVRHCYCKDFLLDVVQFNMCQDHKHMMTITWKRS
uniref:Uncharacterized protein n=1 Tax=Rhizophora mucronata TaxID=61149 RepID=A0A2P2Q7I0_RHIMU